LVLKGEQAVEKAIPTVTDAFEKAAPVAQQVTKSAADVSSTAVTAATPVIQNAIKTARDLLSDQGLNVNDVQSKTETVVKTATDVATPAVKTSINFLTTTEPVLLGYYALAAVGVYLFGPSLLSFLIGAARGYAGDISPAGALDAIMSSGSAFLMDIRTSSEKERTGILDVPSNSAGQFIEVEFAFTENRRLRSQLSNPESVESRVTALQIAALRRLSRSSDVFLLDSNGSVSKRVAKELKALGFGNVYVVSGGYSGWLRSKLQTKPSPMVYRAEVVAPASILTGALGGTMQRKLSTTNRRRLPPGK